MSEVRQKEESIRVRCTAEDLEVISARAERAGMKVSGFVRAAALGREVRGYPDEIKTGLTNLGRLGGVLRLALAQVDQGRLKPSLEEQITTTLAQILATAQAVEDALLDAR